jgi:transposase
VGHVRARKISAQLVEDEDYQLRYERVAGIDVAKAKADVCTRLPPGRAAGRRGSRVEEVPATAREVLALAGRLLADGVELVVMEATSDYWRIWYYLLEGAGLRVQLVNSRHARQLAGRPKTDRKDAQWIARLAEMGLLRPSFVPPPEIRALRDLTRTRLMLVRDRTREWQRLEKLLEARWSSCHLWCTPCPGPRRPAASWRPSPRASVTRIPWLPWPTAASRAGTPPSGSLSKA